MTGASISAHALPKMCIRDRDYSDAGGMLLLDVKNRRWSEEMCRICSVKKEWLPALYESYETIGELLPSVAAELGLSESVKLCAGAGDNAAAAVGTGTVSYTHLDVYKRQA